MDELLRALGSIDTQLYLGIVRARNPALDALAVAVYLLNWNGFVWWVAGLLVARARGFGRRGLWAALTIYLGLVDGWIVAELAKLVFRRARPFDVLVLPPRDLTPPYDIRVPLAIAPDTLIPHPTSFSFPSGDAAFAFGAAVALASVAPRFRVLALLFAVAASLSRVVVGAHYPFDVLAGAAVGIASGLLAPRAVAAVRRRQRWRAFVIPHTHWDREWYERFEGYRARLVPMVSKLLDLLERDPAFRSFTFDGQTIAIQDHLEKRPADRSRVERLVRAERLFIGPWHVLADLILVSGESIVRNLQEGLRSAGELGRASRVAYVADPFGHPAQIPQILRGFGYETYVFARGMGDETEDVGAEFQWEAPSGDRVRATHLIDHYSNGLRIVGPADEPPESLRRRLTRELPGILDRTTSYANGDALLFMVGDDHVEAYPRLPEAVAAMRALAPRVDARIASLEEYAAAAPVPRGVVRGEIVRGRYRPILRGVNSTRVWIKQENVACERLLLERCEPLDALTGGTAREELRELWRMLLQNHPHDSICGCSIDAVHDIDMPPRFAFVRERGTALAERLVVRLSGAGDVAMTWNALPWERDAVVEAAGRRVRVRCAALGLAPAEALPVGGARMAGEGIVENEHLRVEVDRDGSFVVVDRATGERSGRQNWLLDEGDRGDEYTYSYAGPTLGSRDVPGQRTTSAAAERAAVSVSLVLRLPAALRSDRLARSPELVDCPVRMTISLDSGARRVDVAVTVDNRARDHRLRVLCETGTRTLTHRAGAAFALIERANRPPIGRGWIEPATYDACVHDLVAVSGATRGLAVGVDGLREYAVLHDGRTIAITLLRAVGFLSRGDLPERRIHAGPELATPSAQCEGERAYRYCLVPLDARTGLADAERAIREWLSPPLVLHGDGATRSYLSFVDARTPLVLSALRAGPDGALVVRVANPTGEAASNGLRFARDVRAARPVDLREGDLTLGNTGLDVIRTAAPAEVEGAVMTVRLQPYEIGTWLVDLASG